MPGPALLPLASLNGLDLHQNPWNCSCGLKPLVTVTTNMLDIDNTKDGFQWLGRQSVPQSISPVCSGIIANKYIQFRRLALKSPPLGPKWGRWTKKLGCAHPILQSAVCWYGRIGCAPEFFRSPIPLGP